MLARVCGNEAQAVALVDITELVLHRLAPPTLHLDLLGSFAGFRLLFSFGLGLGFLLEPCSVFAAGLPSARCAAMRWTARSARACSSI